MQHDTLRRVDRASGTGYRGKLDTSYAALVRVFGTPHRFGFSWKEQSDGKTQAEWAFQLGTMIITIYDYKEKIEAEHVTEWHIGGNRSPEATVAFVNRELQKAGEQTKVLHIQEPKKQDKYTVEINFYSEIEANSASDALRKAIDKMDEENIKVEKDGEQVPFYKGQIWSE